MKIDKLKISGFKSFADKVEIPVSEGITGIVGPNGCGKSNLIEALRWAMGETSAKRMRADGMDDVIFGGTDIRPPRSSCEVTISIDNSGRTAPAEFNGEDRLEVTRRLDRGEGSSYKVNGKSARARDVQVLFKDAGVGAGSSALVSQGKVGVIINSKPSERRNILEEAAGTAGLASRRHEAELRLRGTEQNLERAEDLERGLSDQLASLRKQARQAKRRKEIDGLVRAAEATSFLVRWRSASARVAESDLAFRQNEEKVKELMLALQAAERELAAAEVEASPAVKARIEAETALALAKAKVENVRKEAQAAKNALVAARKTVERTAKDIEREKDGIGSSGEEYEELKDKKALAEDDRDYDAVLIEEAAAKAAEAKDLFDETLGRVHELSEKLAASRAERTGLEKRRSEAALRRDMAVKKLEETRSKLEEYRDRIARLPQENEALFVLERSAAEADRAVSAAMDRLSEAQEAEAATQAEKGRLSAKIAAVETELKALSRTGEKGRVAGDETRVSKGYEKAAAAAFADGLDAALGEGDMRWWEKGGVMSTPPEGTEPLIGCVTVPEELRAAASGIGIVPDGEDADRYAAMLKPGQSVVTKDGRLLRWDGYRAAGNAAAEAEVMRTARLEELKAEYELLSLSLDRAKSAYEEACSVTASARRAADEAKELSKRGRDELEKARVLAEGAEKERIDLAARISSAEETVAALAEAASAEAAALEEVDDAIAALADLAEEEATLSRLRAEAAAASASYEKARDELDRARRDAEARVLLIANIEQQMRDFDRRLVKAKEHIAELQDRLKEAEEDVARLEASDALKPDAEDVANQEMEEAAALHATAVEHAKASEERVSAARNSAKEAETCLARYREDRARLLAEMKAASEAAQELAREIGERLTCGTADLEAVAGVGPEDDLPDLSACEARVQRLMRERDSIGSVNLLAEQQVEEVEAKLGEANKSRNELREAVRRLRATIADFDREARERLTDAFAQIDGHFRDLFTRLFGGGHAYLKLSGSEDILEAGLEIYACPPGKKLQTMSLLSGGEQALAALALIFAAFLIRPAPVCVLDEVDAPLDDANVDRMCSLIRDMAHDSTRFLVVTHHALTMAKCDRLFGVTMMEKGVSKLAAVDMNSAVALVAA